MISFPFNWQHKPVLTSSSSCNFDFVFCCVEVLLFLLVIYIFIYIEVPLFLLVIFTFFFFKDLRFAQLLKLFL